MTEATFLVENEGPMMLVDEKKLRENIQAVRATLCADPASGIRIPSVRVRLRENLRSEMRFVQEGSAFVVPSAEMRVLGGDGSAPSPLRLFLSGIAACQAVWYAKGAVLAGCKLESLRIDVRCYLDVRGEHGVAASVPPHPQWFVLDAEVMSPSSSAKVLLMAREANARCPVSTLLVKAVPVYERIAHNGVTIRDTLEADVAQALLSS